jgi:hypothetical protein
VFFRKVPAARADKQHRRLVVQRIVPTGFGIVEGDLPPHRVAEVHLPFDQIVPARRGGVLEIGHVDIGPVIQCIDNHLAVGRTGDLDTAVHDVARDRRHPPVVVADCLGLGREIGLPPGIEPALNVGAASEQAASLGSELALELSDKGDRLGGQHLVVARPRRPTKDDAVRQIGGFGHSRFSRIAHAHLPSTMTVTRSPPTPKTAFKRFCR